ncbi:MAG: translation initiation factor [Ignavibacteria bacterium]|nr:translation initiation factor [Ignavibacteria bacterium]
MKSFVPPQSTHHESKKDSARRHRINTEIPWSEMRVLDEDNHVVGILSRNHALRIAEERELDLVEIAPQAQPPVCKIIDYGKFAYEQQKKEKQQRKTQQHQQMKEIRFKWRTDTHDFNFKAKHARTFILEGNKVKASVMFRGREITHHEIGNELLVKFIAALDDVAKIDSPVKFEGRNLTVIMAPDKTKSKK